MGFEHHGEVEILDWQFLDLFNLSGEDTVLVLFIHSEKPVVRLYGVQTNYSTRGNIQSLVANDEREFKILTFRTLWKKLKLTDNWILWENWNSEMNFERDTSYRVLTTARRSRLDLASEEEIWVTSIWGVIVKNFIIRDLCVT